jgi:hypothetical protein
LSVASLDNAGILVQLPNTTVNWINSKASTWEEKKSCYDSQFDK